jgi:anti-sigma factor RsiW
VTTHDRELLGAYALGALEPHEAQQVQQHLAGCPDCRREVAEFADLRRSLDAVPPEAFLDGPPEGGDLLLQRIVSQARTQAPPTVRRAWSGAAVAAAVVLVAAVLGGGIVIGRQTAPEDVAAPPTTTVPANAKRAAFTDPQTGATMDVTVIPKAGWVSVNAKISGVDAGLKCELRVVPREGDALVAGSWLVSEQGERKGTEIQGTALVDPADVKSVDVVTTDGRTMVSVPL